MKIKGYTLEIDGELCCPEWFNRKRAMLKEEAHALLPPHGTARIRPVNVTVTRQRKKKKCLPINPF